jgi:hypothetical protein
MTKSHFDKGDNTEAGDGPPHVLCAMGPPRQADTRTKTAAFVLREAVAHGVIIGTDGNELIMGPPRGMPAGKLALVPRRADRLHA